MSKKVVCYGVRESERAIFKEVANKFTYELILEENLLNHENIETAKGAYAVILRANCIADKINLDKFKEYGIQYVLTRTVGYNHIDLNYAKELGFRMARVPFYSPNAVSELAVSLAIGMMRNIFYMQKRSEEKNFIVDNFMYAKEIRNSTIGIIGTGRIGMETAKAFKGMGAKILGYDVFPNKLNEDILTYVDFETIAKESDTIIVHCPLIEGENNEFINKNFFNKMKNGSFFLNMSRGELINNEDLLEAVKTNKLKGVALDTLSNESQIFFKDFKNSKLPLEVYEQLINFSPRVIITPHIGSYTDEAIKNMIEISLENLEEFELSNNCKNSI
ncbi:NAD(P)-dependent oxidoreductase [Spiroplasma endosymbiont of Cantharis lateralis]|uniref:NAD(P)-dependent oxidoreductase n=1 Tax=Spiroplasma endosymbiont of Cantharis lateralis TaxID=3066277 RepID=UPI00313F07AD